MLEISEPTISLLENTLNNKSEKLMSWVRKILYKEVIGQILPPNEQEYAHGQKRIW